MPPSEHNDAGRQKRLSPRLAIYREQHLGIRYSFRRDMEDLRFAILGTGFWARFQLAAWQTVGGVRCVALYNRTRAKAEALGRELGVPSVYDSPEELLHREKLDFVDIITDAGTHRAFVELAASHRVPAICQKPMATSLVDAEAMVASARQARSWFAIHENWRWQRPIRALRSVLDAGAIGRVFRARIDFCSSFPVFDNQPFLKELDQFLLTDMGSHILDVARFLFGEAASLYCQTHRIHRDIRGEDVATVVMRMGRRPPFDGTTVTCNLSYASRLEHERFPETFLLLEGERGSVELAPDGWLRVTEGEGTTARRILPPRHAWADPAYGLVHASIVDCNLDLLQALRTGRAPETSGEDNLKTVRLVFAAYDSAREDRVVSLSPETPR